MNKKFNPVNFKDYMRKNKPDTYTKTRKLICDWSDQKNYLVLFRMLKFYVRHGMIVEKVHSVISFKQNKPLEKYISFDTKKRNRAKNDFEEDFYNLINNAFYGKIMENVHNRIKVEFTKKDDTDKIIKQQSQLTFNRSHKSNENYDSHTFKQNEMLLDKPIYLGFSVLELSNLILCETYYDILQPYFGQKNIKLHYMDTDSFVLSVNTKDIIKDLKNLENLFDFSNWNENDELFRNKNKKRFGKSTIETHKKIWIDEFVCLRSKKFAFRFGDDSESKLEDISKSQSKNIKFEEFYKCLFGEKYQQECDSFIIRSNNHEMYPQRVKKQHYFNLMINDVI